MKKTSKLRDNSRVVRIVLRVNNVHTPRRNSAGFVCIIRALAKPKLYLVARALHVQGRISEGDPLPTQIVRLTLGIPCPRPRHALFSVYRCDTALQKNTKVSTKLFCAQGC